MNTSKHTPGPWIIRYAKNITAIGTPKGEMQLSLHGVYDGLKPLSVDLHEWKANAHLIAAAPAMYEALRDCVGRLEAYYGDTYPAVIRGKQALAQAEGK